LFDEPVQRALDADRDDRPDLWAPQYPDLRNLGSELRANKLVRYMAINLAGGIVIATLALGGLLIVNPLGLRHLIFADGASWLAVSLLLFGLVVTLGSVAMGTAIMSIGSGDE